MVGTDGNGFQLTDASHGVLFDINSRGVLTPVPWAAAGSTNAWLVLDRNGNGKIDNGGELFGSATQQPEPPDGEAKNGFRALLVVFDIPAQGGNGDGAITSDDRVYAELRLWQDVNSQPPKQDGVRARALGGTGLTQLARGNMWTGERLTPRPCA